MQLFNYGATENRCRAVFSIAGFDHVYYNVVGVVKSGNQSGFNEVILNNFYNVNDFL